MATKNNDVRLTEAINHINNTPVPGLAVHLKNALMTAVRGWKATASVLDQNRLSGLMTQAGSANVPNTKPNRQIRRSIILLRCAICNPTGNWTTIAGDINNQCRGDYASWFNNAVKESVDAVHNTVAKATALIQDLKNNPGTFLQDYPLIVNGPGVSAQANYGVKMEGQVLKLRVPQGTAPISTSAIKVGVTSWLAVRNPAGGTHPITGTDSATYVGEDLMLTTQFTGCTYCFMKNPAGTEVVAAHIDPGAALDGTRLPHLSNAPGGVAQVGVTYSFAGEAIATELRASGGFNNGNGGVFRAHGRHLAPAHPRDGYPPAATSVIILGIKRGGVWEIWRQLHTLAGFTADRIDT